MPKAIFPPPTNHHTDAMLAVRSPYPPRLPTKFSTSTHSRATQPTSPATITAPPPTPPNAPSAPTLGHGTGSDLTVTWTAPAIDSTHGAATGFDLWSSLAGADNWTTVPGVTSPYELTGLAAGAAIDVQLRGSNASGTSAWSATSTLTTTAVAQNAPNAPGAASLAHGTGSDLTVTWAAPAIDGTHGAATGFTLRSSPSGAGTWTTVAGVTSPDTLSGLAAGVAIDVQLQSSNTGGASAWSATSTLTTASAGAFAPNAPAIASIVSPPDGTNTTLTVAWTAPPVDGTHAAATGYNIRYSPAGAGTWTPTAARNWWSNRFSDTSADNVNPSTTASGNDMTVIGPATGG